MRTSAPVMRTSSQRHRLSATRIAVLAFVASLVVLACLGLVVVAPAASTHIPLSTIGDPSEGSVIPTTVPTGTTRTTSVSARPPTPSTSAPLLVPAWETGGRSEICGPDATVISGEMAGHAWVGQGFGSDSLEIVKTSDGAGGCLVAVAGYLRDAAAPVPCLVFLWDDTDFVGTEPSNPSSGCQVRAPASESFEVSYFDYAAGDYGCCPSLPPAVITYTWNGSGFDSSGQPETFDFPNA